ncbi:hypothetical protein NLX83_15695 [Allokutzneria sp. A3M-2-11 16]|uniref:hypothetical protein n=1 Tax=Allokutzneria sp. A3M-2-11 16 TaxID=2962043 RepID=UPI0020B7DAB9|nr:hypothetical protein [Allokutzneria sp. A3M-2-11 16]MCP3800711.1 hypothetical protein [Allokutzneria sp. A3M-2-11 16]
MFPHDFTDFYPGRGKDAQWIGSLEGLGSPENLGLGTDSGPWMFTQQDSAEDFHFAVVEVLEDADRWVPGAAHFQYQGWPWVYHTSRPSHWTYAFDGGHIFALSHKDNAWNLVPPGNPLAAYGHDGLGEIPTTHWYGDFPFPIMLTENADGPIPPDREYGTEFARTSRWGLTQTASAVFTDLIAASDSPETPPFAAQLRYDVATDTAARTLDITASGLPDSATDDEQDALRLELSKIVANYNYSSESVTNDRRFLATISITQASPTHSPTVHVLSAS